MTCPICGGQTKVIDSREIDVDCIKRRRECVECGHHFWTLEQEIPEKANAVKEKTT